MIHAQGLVHEDAHKVAKNNDIFDGHDEAMEIEIEHVLKEHELVIEDSELDSKRYQPYKSTIIIFRCSYFPSFSGKEVIDGESKVGWLQTEPTYPQSA